MEKLLYALQTEAKHLTAYRCSDSNETPNKHVNRTLRRAQANIEFGVDINCCCFSIYVCLCLHLHMSSANKRITN